ncbi:MAG: disulfide bond formation protein B [Rhodomicrobium sp.]
MLYRLPNTRSRWLELLTVENAAFVIAGVSLASLAGAWTIEFMGYKPCPLCLEERIPYYAAVPGGVIAAYFAHKAPKLAALLLAAVCAGLIYNAGVGIYHAGAEWHFWPGPSTCTGDDVHVTSALARRLLHNTAVPCDVAALRIFWLSLAGWSVLLSAGLAGLGGAALFRAWRSQARQYSPR